MGYKLLSNEIDSLFEKLKEEYKIYAPKRFVKQGRYSDTDIIKYDEVTSFEEIVYIQMGRGARRRCLQRLQEERYLRPADSPTTLTKMVESWA